MDPCRLSAFQAVSQIMAGELTAEGYVESCLARIRKRESAIHAWAFIDPELAIRQARQRDQRAAQGPLHGIPVGFKDVFDTADMPTEYNSPIYKNYRPQWDAASVALTRRAGGIVMGKTVTTEFAYRSPGPTRNPHNLEHTPGGSSSGSAAAVADFMIPIGIGTQTGGSTIRPASYCGIVGFKPSFNVINRAGLKFVAESLDHVGVLARTVEDVALYVHAVSGVAMPDFSGAGPGTPRVGVCRHAYWNEAEPAMQEKLELAATTLARKGARVSDFELGPDFDDALADQGVIIDHEAAHAFEFEYQNHRGRLSALLVESIESGWGYSRDRYDKAILNAVGYRARLNERFAEYDFLLTPPGPGEAPRGIARTGNAIFTRLWTMCGVPTVTVPAYTGPQGLPIGIQIVGPFASDARTLYWAEWVHRSLQ